VKRLACPCLPLQTVALKFWKGALLTMFGAWKKLLICWIDSRAMVAQFWSVKRKQDFGNLKSLTGDALFVILNKWSI